MSIEIRELVIRSTIVERTVDSGEQPAVISAALREALLRECRQLIGAVLRERGER